MSIAAGNGGLLSFSAGLSSLRFKSFEQLEGKAERDRFEIGKGRSIDRIIRSESSIDTLSYNSYRENSNSVLVDLQSGKATGVTGEFLGIENFAESSSGGTLSGFESNRYWIIEEENSGFSGNHIFLGFDKIVGKSGIDQFAFIFDGNIASNIENSHIQMWDEKLAMSDVGKLGLDESNIGLIILSACNTALGDRAAEYGFVRFTVTASSQSASASLWPVNDEEHWALCLSFTDS